MELKYSDRIIGSSPVLRKNQTFDQLVIFFIWPFFSLIQAIKNYRRKSSWLMSWLFTGFYGLTFVYTSEALDADRIVKRFLAAGSEDFLTYTGLSTFFTHGTIDFIQPVILYLVRQVTSDTQFLFMVMGLIFGFFYTKNIWFIVDKINIKQNWLINLFSVLFIFVIPIWEFNGFRMWTAAHIFFFGIANYYFTQNKRYLIFIFVTPLIHFSFLFAAASVLIFILLKNVPLRIAFILFFISLFIRELNINLLEYEPYFPGMISQKIMGYTNLSYIESSTEMRMKMNWYALLYRTALNYVIIFVIILLYINFKRWKSIITANEEIFIKFALVFSTLSYLLGAVPFADNKRFIIVSFLFLIASIMIILNKNFNMKLNVFSKAIILFGSIFFLIVEIRVGLDRIAIDTFIFNPLTAFIFESSKPLIIWIKDFI